MPDPTRFDALALAGDLPGLLLDARRLAANAPGFHGRRRSGQGEAFWQYRDHRAEDGARLVDWRRSGRGDRLFVREREREAAQACWFWIDPEPGFNWSADPARVTKLYRGETIALALAILLVRGGERVGALGVAPRTGPHAIERLAHDFTSIQDRAPPSKSSVIYVSDFYAPVESWRARLKSAAATGASGALLMVADPAEEDFPFRGRTLFTELGGARREALLGRAEAARDTYAERLDTQRRAIRALGAEYGFPVVLHRTDHGAAPALALLTSLVSERHV